MTEIIINYIKTELLIGQKNVELLAEDDLFETGLLDSLSIMRLIAFIEEQFEVKIPPQDLIIDNFITVDAMSHYLKGIKLSLNEQ